ncbi:RICIN domain-containing protein [Hymenobacter weizhouensis]|uniref:RICIN domain-containing protein n=1 Tax=Hymenobacter sp. YIM 151500-1 TaxID=2987689 RepID=UPI0022265C1D|nr:RICIN domain-containing protein [Hymenobacter sp. YIM 151500-1]UYZ63734.1 RICIN domain-containing protein [Hymenobacter sp. YIM 151500-1]
MKQPFRTLRQLHPLLLRSLWLLLSLLLAGPLHAQITLPLEVLGPQGTTRQVSLSVADPSKVASVYLRVHRPGFRAASTQPTIARASVQVNGGSWVDITNANCTVFPQEASYGGIGGGFQTVRFTVAASKLGPFRAGGNTLSIRLNQTDGHSSGLRVLELNLLDAGGAKLVPASAFVADDPRKWTAPRAGAADVAEGQRLWKEAALKESPLATGTLKATCASCHHERGLDLKYFNYSNTSIVERTKFHGLSQAQGEQIASYIRSLTLKKRDGSPFDAPGTPWDPPYQPGPGLDSKPVELWSAGAGLNAVLEKDRDIIPHLFPKGTSVAAMKEATSSKGMLNMRELPLSVQLLDWNEWITPLHPVDIWGAEFYTTRAWKAYQRVRQELAPSGRTSVSKERLLDIMQWFTADAINGTLDDDGYGRKLPAGVTWEQAAVGLRRWAVTKIWELNQDFYLEDMPLQLYPNGERGWVGRHRSVFELAPHLSSHNGEQFIYQSHLVGKYFSTIWYHTQVIVNPGYRDNVVHIPVDWKYHLDHIDNLSGWFKETPGEGMRYAASLIKDMQMWDNKYGVQDPGRGWNLREIKLNNLVHPDYDNLFADLSPDFRKNLAEAYFSSWYDKTASHPIADYKRWNILPDGSADTPGGAYDWAPSNFPYYPIPEKLKGYEEYPQRLRDAIVYGRPLGVNGELLNKMADFGHAMWPLWGFDKLKGGTAVAGTGTGLKGQYFNATTLDANNLQPVLTRVDPRLELSWPASPGAGVRENDFTVRWTGYVQAPLSGEYTFATSSDDGNRLWMDNKLLVDAWKSGDGNGGQGKITLEAGKLYPIKLEYLEYGGNANVRLMWSLPNLDVKVIVPTTQLYPELPAAPAGPANGTYRLVARHSGKVLDVNGASQAEGAGIIQWSAHGGTNQHWQLTAVGNGFYKLVAVHSGKALDVDHSGTTNGTKIHQWTDNGSPAQRWKIEATTDGYYKLTAECSGKVLDVSGVSQADGAAVHQWDYVGGLNQQWKLEPVSSAAGALQASAETAASATPAARVAAGTSFAAFPNPSPGLATLELTAAATQRVTVQVRNQQGYLVSLVQVPVRAGRNHFRLPAALPAGTYVLEATVDGKNHFFRLEVQQQ